MDIGCEIIKHGQEVSMYFYIFVCFVICAEDKIVRSKFSLKYGPSRAFLREPAPRRVGSPSPRHAEVSKPARRRCQFRAEAGVELKFKVHSFC